MCLQVSALYGARPRNAPLPSPTAHAEWTADAYWTSITGPACAFAVKQMGQLQNGAQMIAGQAAPASHGQQLLAVQSSDWTHASVLLFNWLTEFPSVQESASAGHSRQCKIVFVLI